MSGLANLLTPPQNPAGEPAVVEWRVKVITSSTKEPETLETEINAWIAAQSVATDTFFGVPVSLGSTGDGNNLRFHAMIPYGYFVPIPAP